MSASVWLNEATPASRWRRIVIAASTGSTPRPLATSSSVLFSTPAGPEVIRRDAGPPRRRSFSAISGRIRAIALLSSNGISNADRVRQHDVEGQIVEGRVDLGGRR